MKTNFEARRPMGRSVRWFTLAMILIAGSGLLRAQDSLVALGQIKFDGAVVNSANTVGGVVSATYNGMGEYDVEITAPGEFTGGLQHQFIVEATPATTGQDDTTIYAWVASVTPDVVTLNFRINDVEHTGDPDASSPVARNFFFTVRRSPSAGQIPGSSTFLRGVARVQANGTLGGGFGVDGINVESAKAGGDGQYNITLSKTGEFVGDSIEDYVVQVAHWGADPSDIVVNAYAFSILSDDEMSIRVNTSDAQSSVESNSATPTDSPFVVMIYRIGDGESAAAARSRLLLMTARINASGSSEARGIAIPGVIFNAFPAGPGKYIVFLTKPNGFVGKNSNDYAAMATLSGTNHEAETIRTSVTTLPDTLSIKIAIGDAEEAGEDSAVPSIHGFCLTLYDLDPVFRADTMIGKKSRLGSMAGNNRYNTSGKRQTRRLKFPAGKKGKSFFAVQNDGGSIDHFRVRSLGDRKGLKARYIRLDGGRANVTAQIRKGGIVAPNLAPGKSVRFLARVKLKPTRKLKKRKIRFRSTSTYSSTSDIAKLKIIPK